MTNFRSKIPAPKHTWRPQSEIQADRDWFEANPTETQRHRDPTAWERRNMSIHPGAFFLVALLSDGTIMRAEIVPCRIHD